MATYDLAIAAARWSPPPNVTRCDIGIQDGRIAVLAEARDGRRAATIDATACWSCPAASTATSISPSPRRGTSWPTASRAARARRAAGGNTTVMPFALQPRGASLRAERRRTTTSRPTASAMIDYSFHLIVTDPTAAVLGQELPALVADGYTSFKVFMTYDDMVLNDRQLLEVFDCARREQALVMVHCEGYDAIKFMTERLEAAGKTAPYYHAVSRPQIVEREAAHRAISHAELIDVPIMIVHVSGREAMEQIRWAQQRGLKVYGETCPQYISLTADDLKGLNMDESGGKYVCSPPPRDRASWDAIWEGIQTGVFQTFSSDHCPFLYDGPQGKSRPRAARPSAGCPTAFPASRRACPILFSEGVVKGRITLEQFVALTSTNHAKMYGLYPRKGSLAVGADADIVLWDPDAQGHDLAEPHAPRRGLHAWEGYEVTGWPVRTLLRGQTVFEDGKVTGRPGGGEFLKRGLSPYAVPRGA